MHEGFGRAPRAHMTRLWYSPGTASCPKVCLVWNNEYDNVGCLGGASTGCRRLATDRIGSWTATGSRYDRSARGSTQTSLHSCRGRTTRSRVVHITTLTPQSPRAITPSRHARGDIANMRRLRFGREHLFLRSTSSLFRIRAQFLSYRKAASCRRKLCAALRFLPSF